MKENCTSEQPVSNCVNSVIAYTLLAINNNIMNQIFCLLSLEYCRHPQRTKGEHCTANHGATQPRPGSWWWAFAHEIGQKRRISVGESTSLPDGSVLHLQYRICSISTGSSTDDTKSDREWRHPP